MKQGNTFLIFPHTLLQIYADLKWKEMFTPGTLPRESRAESTAWKNIGDTLREDPRLRRKSRTSDLVNSRTRRCRRGLNSAVREWNHRPRIEPLIRGRLVAQSACIPTTFFRLYDLGLTLDPTLSLQWQWQMRKQWQAELLSYHATWNRRSWGTSCT